jgi:hypothetical protein
MRLESAAMAKHTKHGGHNRQDEPRPGTEIRRVYDALLAGEEVYINTKCRSIRGYLEDFYGIETKSVGGRKYVRCG